MNIQPAYQLRYTWFGWLSAEPFLSKPPELLIASLTAAWEKDHLRLLEYCWSSTQITMTFSVTPDITPVFFVARVKGRLDHELRTLGYNIKFSRKIAMVTVGESTKEKIEAYIAGQVAKEHFVDPRYQQFMNNFTINDSAVDLSTPVRTKSGAYWYNLHVVLVVEHRFRITDEQDMSIIFNVCNKVAEKHGYAISRLAGA